MKRLSIIAAVLALVSLMPVSGVAERDRGKKGAVQAIRKVVAAYAKAFNHGDVDALTDLWTPQGDYLGPRGQRIEGRDAIRQKFGEFFSLNERTRLKITVTSIRRIGDEVAIVDATTEITPPLEGPPADARSVIVLRKQDGRWLIESARDTLVQKPSNYEHLKELRWLIGDWVDAQATPDDVSVQSTCDWTVNKNYIIRRFTAEVGDRISTAGTQLIGWDPRTGTIRSWVFDSDGGFAEGVWKRRANRWTVEAFGVLPDGSEVSATNTLTRIDDDTFTFKSENRTLDGRPEPDIQQITIQRASSRTAKVDLPGAAGESPRETILPE